MRKIAQFYKVSESEFLKVGSKNTFDQIILPKRATAGSAGYDFFAPETFCLQAGETIKIPTGIRVRIDEGWVLNIYPRISFKHLITALTNFIFFEQSSYCIRL